jgi:protocatechuate 3,4-dioxygenase beta subunit
MKTDADRLSNRRPETGAFFQRDRDWHPPAFTPLYKTSVLRSPQKALLSLDGTLSEITGPVFGHNILGELDNDLIHNFARPGESAIGQRIIVYGRVLDERGKGVSGALLEFWQANAGGRYRHKKEGYVAALDPNFGGCGRTITDEDGAYCFRTIKPGPYPWPNGPNDWRPAHIHFSIFGHGFAQRLITQMYFEGDPLIWKCPIVRTIPDRAAVEQLIAALDMEATIPMDARAYKFDIVLRGRRSSLFANRREGN